MELWSGTFGALASAIAAAIVALVVVKMTNAHQSKLAQAALRAQRVEASRALRRQRDDARASAARQAMAQFVASASEIASRAERWTHDDLRQIGVRLHVSVTEIRILGGEFSEMGDVLLRMSRAMKQLAGRELASRDGLAPEFNNIMWRELNLLVSEASALIPVWWNEEPDDQSGTIDRFERALVRASKILAIAKEAAEESEQEVTRPAG